MKSLVIRIIFALVLAGAAHAQSVETMKNGYTGCVAWHANTGLLIFKSTGTMNFSGREKLHENRWTIPAEVKRIIIGHRVTVTGEFYAEYDCTIQGVDKNHSVVFGTAEQNYLNQSRGFSAFYAAESTARRVVLTVKNLTSLNPKVYHFTGSYRGVIHLDHCRIIDNRGGKTNNSDGYQSADGGTVKNCYFETAEDVIKAYGNITVENTTIKMIEFSVPIQCGWGDYGSGITATFRNLTIIGDSGRAPSNAFIEARQGNYTKNIVIDGLTITNPNASLFRLQQAAATIDVAITRASIDVQKYGDIVLSKGTRTICGSTDMMNSYQCRQRRCSSGMVRSTASVESEPGALAARGGAEGF